MKSQMSQRITAILLALSLASVFFATQLSGETMSKQPTYYVKIDGKARNFVVSINGFTLYTQSSGMSFSTIMPLDIYLAGSNSLSLTMNQPEQGNRVTVEVHEQDGDSDTVLKSIEITGKTPLQVFAFKSANKIFGDLLASLSVVNDLSKVKNYGAHLLELVKNRDIKGLLDELQPKLRDYATQYAMDPKEMNKSFADYMTTDFFKGKVSTDPGKITVIPMAGGKIFEIRSGDDSLISSKSDSGSSKIDVYAGEINGQMRIVR